MRVRLGTLTSLNEGRSVNPGYTLGGSISMCSAVAAQRRPERQPRLHAAPGVREVTLHPPLNEGRSVNPGYTRPRPLPHRLPSALNEGRSVNPGYTPGRLHLSKARFWSERWGPPQSLRATTPAQRRPERQPRLHSPPPGHPSPSAPSPLNEGRSVNPGYTRQVARRRTRSSTLNEGRSVNPGYTPSHLHCRRRRRARSTKAGASTPATRGGKSGD